MSTLYPEGQALQAFIHQRRQRGRIGLLLFQSATLIGIVVLTVLLLNIINQSFGLVAVEYRNPPDSLVESGTTLEELPSEALIAILKQNLSSGLIRRFESEKPLAERPQEELYLLVMERVVEPTTVKSWTLYDSLFRRSAIEAERESDYPNARLEFRSWLNLRFLTSQQSDKPDLAGVRPALKGSLLTILITIIVAFPVGVSGAIYLEEYASDTWFNRVIQTNISNLSGVPSIIYGLLGLAIFVRAMNPITSGALFGLTDPATANGRTILSAGLTLALLILPLIIVNAQEAIRAVPRSLRQASYGVGATQWQTIWHHVLPQAMPGILTGTILAVSRAIGETAPIVVVGASTFVALDPTGPFSRFTALPMQIYQWTARPQDIYRNLAAAAILTLLAMLLTLNATAILLRNRYRGKM